MLRPYVDVHYLNAVSGGSGIVRMPLADLIAWLDARPGVLIRKLVHIGDFQ